LLNLDGPKENISTKVPDGDGKDASVIKAQGIGPSTQPFANILYLIERLEPV
jgi:hypothetical protein